MARHVGIVRDAEGLASAAGELAHLWDELARLSRAAAPVSVEADLNFASLLAWGELHNMLVAARLIVRAAQGRHESRGAHFRRDYPDTREEWRCRQTLTFADLLGAADTADERLGTSLPLVGAR